MHATQSPCGSCQLSCVASLDMRVVRHGSTHNANDVQVPFGKRTNWYVNKLAIGTWQIGGPWGSQDEEAHERALFCYLGGGGNMIDTSDAYGDGYSESFIGKVLAERRKKEPPIAPFLGSDNPIERMYIFSKIGRMGDAPNDATRYKLDTMRDAIQGSRKRLGLEKLDLPLDLVQVPRLLISVVICTTPRTRACRTVYLRRGKLLMRSFSFAAPVPPHGRAQGRRRLCIAGTAKDGAPD